MNIIIEPDQVVVLETRVFRVSEVCRLWRCEAQQVAAVETRTFGLSELLPAFAMVNLGKQTQHK